MKRVRRALAAALGTLVLAAPAMAQSRGGTPGDFDFYVLALSWSPAFCELEGRRKGGDQCGADGARGFVVHGLWPQYQRGFPSECGADRTPTRIALEQARGVFPSEGLARYEWRKHGTCSGLSPADYFAAARRARDAVVVPEELRQPSRSQRFAPLEIERAFAAANRGLRPDMMAVACKGGMLQEVRICIARDLRGFTPCQEVDRGGCRARDISVPAAE